MILGREKELEKLDQLHNDSRFHFLIMYGRRRVGKTTILQEFAHKNDTTLFFSAQEKNDALNLADFSRLVQEGLDKTSIAPFQTWSDAFRYISKKADPNKKLTLIIDEFPFIAKQNASVKSSLQHVIDHEWKEMNILLILCGSSVSVMIDEVLGYESPLYGRNTEVMEVKPFDYLGSTVFMENRSNIEKAICYGILGGIPRYLQEFDASLSIEENIREKILRNGAFLNDEPSSMLRMELREPSTYGSILEAISKGYNQIKLIAEHIHEEPAKVSKYMNTLGTLRLIEKMVPCTEPKDSRKAIYRLSDNFFSFWYKYIFANRSYYEYPGEEDASREIMQNINEYMGHIFERICTTYIEKLAYAKKLPFVPAEIGRWWGNNPVIKAQDDVDILAVSTKGEEALFCECKFTNKPMPMSEYDDLVTAMQAFPSITSKHMMFISKSGYTSDVIKRANKEGAELKTLEDVYSF